MNIKVNGKIEEIHDGLSIHDYLGEKNIAKDQVVLELNMNILKKEDLRMVKLKEGDRLEILRFVGGG